MRLLTFTGFISKLARLHLWKIPSFEKH